MGFDLFNKVGGKNFNNVLSEYLHTLHDIQPNVFKIVKKYNITGYKTFVKYFKENNYKVYRESYLHGIQSLFFLSDDKKILVSHHSGYYENKTDIYYIGEKPNKLIRLLTNKDFIINKVYDKGFYLVETTEHGPSLVFKTITDRYQININENYNDDFIETNKLIVDKLNVPDKSGLVLLYGEPGTGKTNYIRHLISKLSDENKKVIFLSKLNLNILTDPRNLRFLYQQNDSIFILEDSEDLLISRDINNNPLISMLLNLTDGLMGDFVNIKFICTFNTDIENIDQALLRKGRITCKYEFKKLAVNKANNLLKKQFPDSTHVFK